MVALWPEAGFGHTMELLEQSNLCSTTGREHKDKLAPALGWAEVPPAKELVGCGAAAGAAGNSTKQN